MIFNAVGLTVRDGNPANPDLSGINMRDKSVPEIEEHTFDYQLPLIFIGFNPVITPVFWSNTKA